ncbi:ASCH/PUA domain-containing protein [Hymenobacter cellulosivorans]|uniref:DUF3850 domain-containing protein n=1 Tax=Hymenobacter cellulosivorans TaxID=2932249 RepID=A0ABY4FDF0_9BACT|nr:ASCH/PUA domain-containing protein [Hymenobacter cellulosivorans]UOQ53999.1 DUF3850 domain-containing protein [Hymenobacter cellulosivorans]
MQINTSPAGRPARVAPRQTHELKTWPVCFAAVESGAKPFDVRENDRNYQVGDVLLLREYEPETEHYSGRTLLRSVSYVLQGGSFGLEAGWCVVGFGALPPLPPGINDTKLW